jgi:hypothetical protein
MKYPHPLVAIMLTAVILIASLMGPALAGASTPKLTLGSTGTQVRHLQQYLDRSMRGDLFDYQTQVYTDYFGATTEAALKQWQQLAGFQPSGRIAIGKIEWQRLKREATAYWRSTGTNARARNAARTHGLAIDANQTTGRVNVLRYDRAHKLRIVLSIAATFGGYHDGVFYPTTNGYWSIFREGGPNDHSKEFHHAPMPWSAYFHNGEAFHYGNHDASHGCIHIPNIGAAKYIGTLPIGTRVEVHA